MRWRIQVRGGTEYSLSELCKPESSDHVAAVIGVLTKHGVNGPYEIVITQDYDGPNVGPDFGNPNMK